MLILRNYLSILFLLIIGTQPAFATFPPSNEPFEILYNPDDSVMVMNLEEATGISRDTFKKEKPDACEARGKGRLGTIRELLLRAQAEYGATGIKEMYYPGDPFTSQYPIPDGYEGIYAVNPDGKKDGFYYSKDGYNKKSSSNPKHPAFDGVSAIWTSSTMGAVAWTSYIFNGVTGEVTDGVLSEPRAAIACSKSWPQTLNQCWWCDNP